MSCDHDMALGTCPECRLRSETATAHRCDHCGHMTVCLAGKNSEGGPNMRATGEKPESGNAPDGCSDEQQHHEGAGAPEPALSPGSSLRSPEPQADDEVPVMLPASVVELLEHRADLHTPATVADYVMYLMQLDEESLPRGGVLDALGIAQARKVKRSSAKATPFRTAVGRPCEKHRTFPLPDEPCWQCEDDPRSPHPSPKESK